MNYNCFPYEIQLWRFNFATNKWTLVKTTDKTPSQLASMSMVRCGRFIVMYGGTGYPFGYTSTNRVRLFDTETQKWSTLRAEEAVKEEMPIRTYGQVEC